MKIDLMYGDCLELMKTIPDGSVDAIVSDIPYGISFSTWDVLHENKNSALLGKSPAQEKSALFKRRGKPLNGWSKEDKDRGKEFSDWCSVWLKEVYRVLKPCSPLLVMTGRQYQHRFTIAAEDEGFLYKDYISWHKTHAPFRAQNINKVLTKRGIDSQGNYRLGNLAPVVEPIVYLIKPYKQGSTITEHYIETGLGCFDANVLTENFVSLGAKVKDKLHETQKPVELMSLLVRLVTKDGHTILDPFMGSGTTGVACANTGRNFIGIEKDEKYFQIASERINKA